MKNKTLEAIVWVLIYGGLLTASLGVFLHDIGPASAAVATVLIGLGLAAAVIGVLLIFVRAKRREPTSAKNPKNPENPKNTNDSN